MLRAQEETYTDISTFDDTLKCPSSPTTPILPKFQAEVNKKKLYSKREFQNDYMPPATPKVALKRKDVPLSKDGELVDIVNGKSEQAENTFLEPTSGDSNSICSLGSKKENETNIALKPLGFGVSFSSASNDMKFGCNGFKSAGNKPLPNVSEESLKRAKKFLNEFDENPEKICKQNFSQKFGGFKSASNKPLSKISPEALQRSSQLIESIENSTAFKNTDCVHPKKCSAPFKPVVYNNPQPQAPTNLRISDFLKLDIFSSSPETKSKVTRDVNCFKAPTDVSPLKAKTYFNRQNTDKFISSQNKVGIGARCYDQPLNVKLPTQVEALRKFTVIDKFLPNSINLDPIKPHNLSRSTFVKSNELSKNQLLAEMSLNFTSKATDEDVFMAINKLDHSLDCESDLGPLLFDDFDLKLFKKGSTSKTPSPEFQSPQIVKKDTKSLFQDVPKTAVKSSPIKPLEFKTPRLKMSSSFIKQTISKPLKSSNLVAPGKTPPSSLKKLFNMEAKNERKTLKSLYIENIKKKNVPLNYSIIVPADCESSGRYKFSKTIDLLGVASNRIELGPDEAHTELLKRGANINLCTKVWVRNHYKQIVWKMATMYRTFPEIYEKKWEFNHVVNQLCYRYETEVNLARSPVLKMIAEGDYPPGNHMILKVSKILTYENEPLIAMEGLREPLLQMTDGWYELICIPDKDLQRCIELGKIYAGCKLRTCCATLDRPDVFTSILEARSKVKLRIYYNCTRRARPWKKLGLQRNPRFVCNIYNMSGSGPVPLVDVIVVCKYEMCYYYKEGNSQGTFLTHSAMERKRRGHLLEKFYGHSASRTSDIQEQSYEHSTSTLNFVPVLKLIVRDCNIPSNHKSHISSYAELIIWNAGEDIESMIVKGSRFKIYNLEASGHIRKYKGENIFSLSSKANTSFKPQKIPTNIDQFDITKPEFVSCSKLNLLVNNFDILEGEEIDIVAAVASVSKVRKLEVFKNGFEYEIDVFLTDMGLHVMFVRIFSVFEASLRFEVGEVIELKNLIYTGFDSNFRIHNARFTYNSKYARRKLNNKVKPASFCDELISAPLSQNSCDTADFLKIPPNFHDNLPPNLLKLLKSI